MPRRSAQPPTTMRLCPRGKRFTARPLRCERPWLAGLCCLSRRLISMVRCPRPVESSSSSRVMASSSTSFGTTAWSCTPTCCSAECGTCIAPGERWRKPSSQLRVGITVDGFAAVCFGARTVETYREFDTHRHPGLRPHRPRSVRCLCRPRRGSRGARPVRRPRRSHRRGAARSTGGERSRQRVSQRDPVGLEAASVCSGVDACSRRHGTDHHGGDSRSCRLTSNPANGR